MHAYKKKDANPQKGIDSQGISIEKTGYCRGNFSLDVSVTAFAAHIGISRVKLSRVLDGHAAVTADMDLRLAVALGTSAGYWLALQSQRDLWVASVAAKERKKIKRVTVPELAAA